MLMDNLIDVFLINIGVPDVVGVNHGHGPLFTTVQTTCRIHSDTTLFSSNIEFLGALLGVISHGLSIMLLTTLAAIFSLVSTEKQVVLVIGHKIEFYRNRT